MEYSNTYKILYLHTNITEMLETAITSVIIIAACVALLAIKIIVKKNGRFPNTHVGGNKHLAKKGIGCVQSQDREAQRRELMIPERMEEILNNQ